MTHSVRDSRMVTGKMRERRPGGAPFATFITIVAVLYGLWLANLPLLEFKDRANYLVYAQASGTVSDRYLAEGWRAFIFNEPVWLLINDLLARVLVPTQVMWVIIFVPAVIVAIVILRRGPQHFFYLIFLLIVPFVIKNHIIHLRQGVAIAIFFAALQVRNRPVRIILLLLTPLIHSSFFVLLLVYFLSSIIGKGSAKLPQKIGLLFACSLSGMAVFSMIAEWSGARQGDGIEFDAGDASGFGFVLWTLVLLVFFFEGPAFVRANLFPISILLLYLAGYFLTAYAGRILESGVLAVFLAALSLTRARYTIFIVTIVAYSAITYLNRLDQPLFGWGL